MACKLDVNEIVHKVVNREVKNISKINKEGFANVTKDFGKSDLDMIKKLNDQFGEKVITYKRSEDNDLPGSIQINISDSLYDRYINIIEKSKKNNRFDKQINYQLSAVEILSSDKAEQVFTKGKKNGWDLNKILTELQVPKEQKQIILDKYKDKVSEQDFIKDFNIVRNNEPHPEDANTYDVIYKGNKVGIVALLEGKFSPHKTIKGVRLEEKYRNKGLGKQLYKYLNYLANKGGGVLTSDPEQVSESARRVWDSLIKEGLVNKAKADEQVLKFNYNNLREDIITSLLAENSFVVEVNTAETDIARGNPYDFNLNGDSYSMSYYQGMEEDITYYFKNNKEISYEEHQKAMKDVNSIKIPTQYYSNLTVPGGTNYTENEIATPDIIPNIKGHAQFSTDNGIGWFRGDDKIDGTPTDSFTTIDENGEYTTVESYDKIINTKTRRILEVQSDLFQKGRSSKDLTTLKAQGDILTEEEYNSLGWNQDESYQSYLKSFNANETQNSNQNQFLQLLNKNNNWVNFFIESIIQDSAKKGYEKVLFPKGDTAAKIEGHQTLESLIKSKKSLINEKNAYIDLHNKKIDSIYRVENIDNNLYLSKAEVTEFFKKNKEEDFEVTKLVYKNAKNIKVDNLKREIETFKQEINDIESGRTQLSSIAKFYEDTITNILNKKYKGRVNEITDEFGNKWNEVELKLEDSNQSFTLNLERQQQSKPELKSFVFDDTKISKVPDNLTTEEFLINRKETLDKLFNGSFKPLTANEFLRNLYNLSDINLSEEGLAFIKAALPTRAKIKWVTTATLGSEEVVARYDSLTRTIMLNKDVLGDGNMFFVIESVLHEIVHDMTVNALNQPKTDKQKAFRDKMNEAFVYYEGTYKRNNDNGDNYGFTNVEEFVAEIMTNQAFRDKLKTVEYNVNKNLFQRILDIVKSFFGLELSTYQPSKVNEILNSIIDIAKEEYSTNEESSLHKTYDKQIFTKKEIEDDLSKELTDVKTLMNRILTTLEAVKSKSINRKGDKYKDKYEKIEDQLKTYQDNEPHLAILNFLNFSIEELGMLEGAVQKEDNKKNLDFQHKLLSYMSIFSNTEEIGNIIESLYSENTINKKEYDKLSNTLKDVISRYEKIESVVTNSAKNILADRLAPHHREVKYEYEQQFKKDYKQSNKSITESEYVKQKLDENQDVIKAESRARIRKGLDLISKDLDGFDTMMQTEKDIDNTLLNIYSTKLDKIDSEHRLFNIQKRNRIAALERKLGLTGSNNKQRYSFMLDINKDSQYYVTKYKSEFNDIIESYDNQLKNLEYGSKEHKKVFSEKKEWIKNNTTKDKKTPLAKWLNPKYSKMTNIQKEYYDFFISEVIENNNMTANIKSLIKNPLNSDVVFIKMHGVTQSNIDKILSGNVANAVKTSLGDLVKNRKDETSMGERDDIQEDDVINYEKINTDINNKPVNTVPIFYRSPVTQNDQSYDLSTMLALDTSMSKSYQLRKNFEAESDMITYVIGKSQVQKRNSMGYGNVSTFLKVLDVTEKDFIKQKGVESNLYKKMKSIAENRMYNITDVHAGKLFGTNKSINQIANSISGYTADLQLGLNYLTALPNVLQAKIQNKIEAAGKDYYSSADLRKAEALYFADIGAIIDDVGSTTYSSKINMINEMYDTMGNASIIKNEFENKSKLRALANRGSMHIFNHMGEHYAQSALVLAVMNAIKVKNSKGQFIDSKGKVVTKDNAMTLYEAYEKVTNEDGTSYLKLNEHASITSHSNSDLKEEGHIEHQQLIRKLIIKLHGQYDTKFQAHLQRFWWGKLLMMFRKWMVSSYQRRYKGVQYSFIESDKLTREQKFFDYETQRFDEGTYTSMFRFMKTAVFPAIKNFKLELATTNWENMSDMERSNVKKVITELLITAMMATAAMLMYAAADDDDDETLFMLAYIFRRQQSELMQFYHPGENLRVFRSPAVSLNTVEKTYSLLSQIMPWAITEEYENGKNKGQNKAWIKFKKIAIIAAQTERDPKEMFNFLENVSN